MYEDYNYNKNEDLNHCLICKKAFNEGDSVSIIELPKGPFKLVCRACLKEAEKLISMDTNVQKAVTRTTEGLKEVDKLWRYMDLAKFISMLKDSNLFFSSPKGFNDIYEGAHGELRNKKAWDDFYLSHARAAIITAPDNCWHYIDESKLEEEAQRLVSEITTLQTPVFISCWYQNDYESEAMWKMYSKNVANAIAIQTDYKELKRQIGDKAKINKVMYIDYSKRFVGPNELFWYKRKSFEYEREVRALLHSFGNNDSLGIAMKVDLESLIKGVYISPYAPAWFYSCVVDLIDKYGYKFEVNYSSMTALPF